MNINKYEYREANINKYLLMSLTFMAVLFLPKISLAANEPVLFFSDLESGPKTGWEGSTTKGAAVTVWGNNFGPTRGSSYITVNGSQLANDLDYAEWRVTTNNARGLERITFYLNNNSSDGAGTISVTVDGVTSNTLPFTVRSGNIYFVAKDGNDSNDGRYTSDRGGGNGPWLHFYKSNPNKNTTLHPGDVVYIRAGDYTETDEQDSSLYIRDYAGVSDSPFAIVGYPGEWPVIGAGGSPSYGIRIYTNEGSSQDIISYFEIHKLIFENISVGFHAYSVHHIRFIGDIFRNNTANAWSGIIDADGGWHWEIYGVIFKDCGRDYYKHAIYARTTVDQTYDWCIGWCEFDNYRSDLSGNDGIKYGSGAVNLRNNNSSRSVHHFYIHDCYFHNMPTAAPMYLENDGNANMADIYFYNNIITDAAKQGSVSCTAAIVDQADSLYMYNNTFYDVGSTTGHDGGSMGILTINRTPAYAYSKNNIYRNTASGIPYTTTPIGYYDSDNDVYYGGGSLPSGANYSVTNPIQQDPLFISTSNFHLQSTSPARDAGTSDVNAIVARDYDYNSRPQGCCYDIGAYEYVSGAPVCGDSQCNGTETCSTCPQDCGVCPDTTPPAPPTGVTVQ